MSNMVSLDDVKEAQRLLNKFEVLNKPWRGFKDSEVIEDFARSKVQVQMYKVKSLT